MLTQTASIDEGRSGPEALFTAIAPLRLSFYPAQLATDPVRFSMLFFASILALVLFLTQSQVSAPDNGVLIDTLPSESVLALLIGIAIFPLRLIIVPVASYVVIFTLCYGLKIGAEPDYLPQGLPAVRLFLASLVLNGLAGLAAGLLGRLAIRLVNGPVWQRRSDLVLAGGTTLSYGFISFIGITLVLGRIYDPAWLDIDIVTLWETGLLRAARLAICAGLLMLLMLETPNARHVRAAALLLPLFIGLAVLRHKGITFHPTVDVMLLCLMVAALLPPYAGIAANVTGMIAYIGLTGDFVVQIPLDATATLKLEVVSVILLALVYVMHLFRHQAQANALISQETIERMQRVQSFATIGYFVIDLDHGRMSVDDVAASILGVGRRFDVAQLVGRVRPADRYSFARGMTEPSDRATVFSFALTPGSEWTDAAVPRFLSVYVWHEQISDLRHVAYGAFIDLTEEHRREQALARALATLSEQQNRQTQLFSIVSHEIRTPASVVSMLVEEMENGADWKTMGPRMRAVSDQLLSVLADMRQTVRPAENLPIRLEEFRPQDLAETVRNTFLLMAEAKGVTIELDLTAAAAGTRTTDRVRLNQALSNLVKNAIIHAECTRIVLSYAEEERDTVPYALWRVRDNGKGIPAEARAQLFEAFMRGRESSTRTDGSGLGLYIARSSIELLGGRVDHVDSSGGGAEFLISLPLAEVILPPPPAPPPAPDLSAEIGHWRVLVVEDSQLIGELLVARLSRIFKRIEWARNGAEGLAAYERERPDLVLTDLFMPELGGDELTAALRAKGATCPIIGMTAAAIGDERVKFEGAGTDHVMTKPVSTAQLLDLLGRVAQRGDAEV